MSAVVEEISEETNMAAAKDLYGTAANKVATFAALRGMTRKLTAKESRAAAVKQAKDTVNMLGATLPPELVLMLDAAS